MKKVVLIDGHNLLFRMFYGIPASIKNSKGKEIKGLIGFIGSLKKIINEFNPDSLFVVFDSETSTNDNLNVDNNYKKNRIDYSNVGEEDNPFAILKEIKEALDYLKINYLEVENYEADDYIASIVTNKKNQYIIVSTDSDFLQLVNSYTHLYVPRGKKSILYDESLVYEKYHVTPSNYILFKALVGDKSDNIKGIPGIGLITAAKILKYTTLERYIEENKDTRYAKSLENNLDIINKNISLITMNKNIPIKEFVTSPLDNKIKEYRTYEIIEQIGAK